MEWGIGSPLGRITPRFLNPWHFGSVIAADEQSVRDCRQLCTQLSVQHAEGRCYGWSAFPHHPTARPGLWTCIGMTRIMGMGSGRAWALNDVDALGMRSPFSVCLDVMPFLQALGQASPTPSLNVPEEDWSWGFFLCSMEERSHKGEAKLYHFNPFLPSSTALPLLGKSKQRKQSPQCPGGSFPCSDGPWGPNFFPVPFPHRAPG